MSSSAPSFESLRENYIQSDSSTSHELSTPIVKTNKPHILDQIISYDYEVTEHLIQQINDEYIVQKKLNNVLINKNYEKNKNDINNFVTENKDNVQNQIHNLSDIFHNYKNLFNNNLQLKEEENEYNELIDSEEVKEISKNLHELKSLKNNILRFLHQNGVHNINT